MAFAAILAVLAGLYPASGKQDKSARDNEKSSAGGSDVAKGTVELDATQVKSVKVDPVCERSFVIEREAVGNIDFDEDMAVQVFSPYQGKIASRAAAALACAELGTQGWRVGSYWLRLRGGTLPADSILPDRHAGRSAYTCFSYVS